MFTMEQQERAELLADLYKTNSDLQLEYDEALYSAIAYHEQGKEEQAKAELDKLDFVSWQLTNLESYLAYYYKQVAAVTLH